MDTIEFGRALDELDDWARRYAEGDPIDLKNWVEDRRIVWDGLGEMRKALEAAKGELREWAMPEATHEGSCGPEAGCDGNCMNRSYVARHNHIVRQVRDALGNEQPKGDGITDDREVLQRMADERWGTS